MQTILPHSQQQQLAARRQDGHDPCPRSGCWKYEKGWVIEVNLADPADAGVARYIREGRTGRKYVEEQLVAGAIRFHFQPEQPCLGHKIGWGDPLLFANQRKVKAPEFMERLGEGVEAIAVANTRLKEMED